MCLAINMIRGFLLFSFICYRFFAFAQTSSEEAFTEIYQNKKFGTNSKGEAHSGGGSTLINTKIYREFLQNFFKDNQIRSVVDMGCGDWEFSQAMDWEGIEYFGYDVVDYVIDKNKTRFENDHIHFFKADGIFENLPCADLLICKDVLQHLSNHDILVFLQQIEKYRYCLITNDVDPVSLTSQNPDIETGGFRPLDLTKAPFSIKGVKVLTYLSDSVPKQVLLICNVVN